MSYGFDGLGGGFSDPEFDGNGNILITSAQSPNFVSGSQGWQITKTGNAEFNNVTIRGELLGAQFIANASGIFFYSGTPANGNLIGSWTPTSGTDGFGNSYPVGISLQNGTSSLQFDNAGNPNIIQQIYKTGASNIAGPFIEANQAGAGTATYNWLEISGGINNSLANVDNAGIFFNSSSADGTSQIANMQFFYSVSPTGQVNYFIIDHLGAAFPLGFRSQGNASMQPSAIGSTVLSANVAGTSAFDALRILPNSIAMGSGSAARDTQIARTGTGALAITNPASAHSLTVGVQGNLVVGTTAGLGDNGVGVLEVANATTAPSTNPSAGGVLFSSQGVPKWRTSGGNILSMVKRYYASASSTVSNFTAETLIPGTLINVVVEGSDATVYLNAVFDLQTTTGATFTGRLQWNGVDQSQQAILVSGATGEIRGTMTQQWMITGVTAGIYTAQLSATCSAASASNSVNSGNTTLSAEVLER